MSNLKKIREKLGLSQPDFACYLDVSVSMLKMAETGARELPTEAFLKFSAIIGYDATLPKKSKVPAAATAGETETQQNKELHTAIRKCRVQAFAARRRLETVQVKYEQATQLQALCRYSLLPEQAAKIGETEKSWLEIMQRSATKRLKQYSPATQEFLQWKLAWLEFGEAKGNEIMGIADADEGK